MPRDCHHLDLMALLRRPIPRLVLRFHPALVRLTQPTTSTLRSVSARSHGCCLEPSHEIFQWARVSPILDRGATRNQVRTWNARPGSCGRRSRPISNPARTPLERGVTIRVDSSFDWSARPGSNRRPRAWEARALPTELLAHPAGTLAKLPSRQLAIATAVRFRRISASLSTPRLVSRRGTPIEKALLAHASGQPPVDATPSRHRLERNGGLPRPALS